MRRTAITFPGSLSIKGAVQSSRVAGELISLVVLHTARLITQIVATRIQGQ